MQLFHMFITLRFICRSTCFGRLHAHHQDLITALTASGFSSNAATTNAPTVKPEAVNAVVSSW
jgi:hypothetical protein